jgi:phosphoglycolate phosphatase
MVTEGPASGISAQTKPAQTLMVGDSQNDGIAARAAGCPVALVTYGYNHGDPITEAPHDLLLGSLADLLAVLRS